jgi:sugar/nucleoside kinase (ribokinase family)
MPRVVVVGDVIDDILVKPKTAIRPDTDTQSEIKLSPGGSAANFACWLASQGVDVDFIGRVNHKDVARHSEDLKSYGVNPLLQADPKLPTGSIVVLVEGEQRSFLTDRGANKNLDVSEIEDFGAALYLSGYSLFGAMPAKDFKALIRRAKSQGAMVVCDPGSAGFIADYGVVKFFEATKGVDLFTPSLEEGRVLTGELDPKLIGFALLERYPLVALTLGKEGLLVCHKNEATLIPAKKVKVVDSTGAGDATTASLVADLVNGIDFDQAAKNAVIAGANAVTRSGGRP